VGGETVVEERAEAALPLPPGVLSDHLLLTGPWYLGPLARDEIESGRNIALTQSADGRGVCHGAAYAPAIFFG
jgi:hypothetical protein